MSTGAPVHAWVGLGGNLGDVRATLEEALVLLPTLPHTELLRRSAIYRTPPWGNTRQPPFLNAAAELRTGLAPAELLAGLLALERRFGRDRASEQRWGPRRLDLDLLVFAGQRIDEPGLSIPHPRMHERAFVLVPLAEIAPELQVPGQGRVADLLAAVDTGGIEAIP